MKNSIKRIIVYRVFSIISEFLIVFAATGSLVIPTVVSILCIFTHTSLHWIVERIWKDRKV